MAKNLKLKGKYNLYIIYIYVYIHIFIFTDAELGNLLAGLIQDAKTSEKVNNSDTGE